MQPKHARFMIERLTRRYIHHYQQPSVNPALQASSLQHPYKNWHDQRKNKLTASTFGGAIGLWPRRRVQLWLEKLGAVEPFRLNFSVACNNTREEEALEDYIKMTNNYVWRPPFQVHHTDNWIAASPDGGVIQLQSRGVLEIKIPYTDRDMKTIRPWKRIPLYYMPQAQGLLEITGMDWLDFYVWTRENGSNLFRVYRDVEYWALLKVALEDFWWNHVEPAKKICSEYYITNPLVELRLLKPEPRHELCAYIVYQSKLLVDKSRLVNHRSKTGKLYSFHNGVMNYVSH